MTDGDHRDSKELAALEKVLLDETADPVDLPFSLLKAITGNFSLAHEIGRGGFGAVYKGLLPSGLTVAVKKLYEKFEVLDKNFESEVACLVGVRHRNMVRFLGYCSETQHVMMPYDGKLIWADVRQRLLCFEYLPKGCLADYLSDASCRLLWTTRYQIIKGICEGIHYLHRQRIIHMDLKPQNVLLDDNMVPRIADFGLSRRLSESRSHAITEKKLGTMGYMAPEFIIKGEITFKIDIYSLGVIIMEILMGRKECSNVKEISFASKLTDELKLMDDSAAPSQQQSSELEVEQEDYKVSQEKKRKASAINFSKLADDLALLDDSAAPSQLLEMEQEDGKVSDERKAKAATVSLATEVMSTVSGKLTTFRGNEYKKRKEVRKQASFLEKELSTINASLEQLELMDELAPWVKTWRHDVKEISYGMENCIDDFMRQFGGEDAETCFVWEAAELHKRLCELHRLANEMKELRTLLVEANARRESYKVDDCKPSFGSVAVDPRLPAVYQEATNLVGIDGPREEVANWLMNTQRKLKVVSIVGFGVETWINIPSHDRGFDDIIEVLRKYLVEKRYLIVVDDLWDQSTWKIISSAFPENENGSRIIVTTRLEDVASAACHNDSECIYTMKPLNEDNSRMLFCNRVFGSKAVCPPHLQDVAVDILKKCGGLPLAIITISSLLATQRRSMKHWESIRKSLGAQSSTVPSLKEINTILNLSYKHLPLHLRACFLYLGMYPEDYIIGRDDLVKQWIAEGFVSSLHGPDLEDVGRSYFNELVNRSMIQPSDTECGQVLSCTVHDMMLNLILSKCVEDNFISVAYNSEDMARLLHGCKYKVRRLSLSSMAVGGAIYDTAVAASLSQVRSFMLFEKPAVIPPLFWFKYLRVLVIFARGENIVDLTSISQLFQLRYLMVTVYDRVKIELPTKLGELIYLETLDAGNCRQIGSIPSDIVHLPRLSYLVLPNWTKLPEGIENMKSLRTLQGLDLQNSSVKGIMGLGELTNLRELGMRLHINSKTLRADALACSIGKLCDLKSLSIFGNYYERENVQQLSSLSNPFQHIERLDLKYWQFRRVPKWMGALHCLCFLKMQIGKPSTNDVHLLGELPSLVHLELGGRVVPDERVILGARLFPVLEYFDLYCEVDSTAFLWFEAGAMPNLRTLCLQVMHWHGSMPDGLEHLLHLQEILVYGPGAFDDVTSSFREASLVHPNRPSINGNGV
ncbi:hypothetical protein CFC21_055547 [Triticum aestivum]|uniref:Protein kinase domain-containing protein n=2 Tax=Triticum aestivum TaxID=4565 RepID=A0A9R1KA57_WHEAT|nr:hypothetical protein CFC21_055547 [Triticum aestivum]